MELIGHRGCGEQYPENTVRAVRESARALPTVEVDVRRCASGEPVVFHDETLDRLTDAEGPVADADWAELRDLEILDSGETVPLLGDVLEAVPDGVTVQVELKERGLAADVRDAVVESGVDAQVSSFDTDALREVVALDWSVPTGYLFEDDPETNLETALELGCAYVHPHFDCCLETDVVEAAHDHGLGVIAWKAARTPEDVAALREVDVDGVTVDRHDLA